MNMSTIATPDPSGNPHLHATAAAMGVYCFDRFTAGRPTTYYTYRGRSGFLLPDLIRDPGDLREAAADARMLYPDLNRLLPKSVIEVMVRLARPGSFTAQAVPDLPLTDQQYADLIYVPLDYLGTTAVTLDLGVGDA